MTEKEWIIESFMDALKASLTGMSPKEGILSYCYINDMIPKCHPEEPSDKELLNMILEHAVPNKSPIKVNNITYKISGYQGIAELKHSKKLRTMPKQDKLSFT